MWVQIYKIGDQMWDQFSYKDKTGMNLCGTILTPKVAIIFENYKKNLKFLYLFWIISEKKNVHLADVCKNSH